jgi:multidrug efflux pump subunit AcrB
MFRWIIKQRTAVYALVMLVVIVGVIAYRNLPRENNPEIKLPYIIIHTVYPGVPPMDMETLITRPLEDAIDGLAGVKMIQSESRQSVSTIFVEFTTDMDTETALRRVKDRVDGKKGELPGDANDPVVQEMNISDWPIYSLAVSHPDGVERLTEPARLLRDRLKRIPGVLNVSISGGITKEVAIDIDPFKLQHYKLTLGDVSNAIRAENTSVPGGIMRGDVYDYSIFVTGEIVDVGDFSRIMVNAGAVSVPLGQLGEVSLRPAKAESYARIDGKPAITLDVTKRTGANLVSIADTAKRLIQEGESLFPAGTILTESYDESRQIRDTIFDLENNMFSGFILVLLVTILFLGKRNAFFVALAIPLSMLISFFVLQAMGYTLNTIVLFSLIMALGMLVDNGIVMVENIYRHAMMGKDKLTAAADGAAEIALPILSSTLTTCLAFFPIIFMPGIMGDFMSYLPITVIIVLTSSLFVALVVNPVFCSRFLVASEKNSKRLTESTGLFAKLQAWYVALLRRAVAMPLRVAGLAAVVVLAGVVLYGIIGKETVFFPAADPWTAVIRLEARQGTPLHETDRLVRQVEAIVRDVAVSMDHYSTTTGRAGADESNKATIRVEFVPYMERKVKGAEATERLKAALEGFRGAEVVLEEIQNGPPSGHDISYKVTGQDYGVIGSISERIHAQLKAQPGLKGITTDYEAPKPEVYVAVDRRKAAYLGVSTLDISSTVRSAFNGSKAGTFRDGKDEYDVVLRYQDGQRNSIEQLRSLRVPRGGGDSVMLADVAEIGVRSSEGVVKRKDLQRTVEVYADFKPGFESKVAVKTAIEAAVKAMELPPGYTVDTGSGAQEQQESTDYLLQAFLVALFLIAIVLIVQFNSLVDPLIILSAVALSIGGVFWGYALSGKTFVIIMSGIGCIALAGIVVNNGIILVDYTNSRIKAGLPWRQAVVEAGRTRLRPVLLTAITTILGMVPMALGISFDVHSFGIVVGSEQSVFWEAFAWSMIFGLAFSTVMTLIVVPALLAAKMSLKERFAAKRRESRPQLEDVMHVA